MQTLTTNFTSYGLHALGEQFGVEDPSALMTSPDTIHSDQEEFAQVRGDPVPRLTSFL